MDPSFAGSSHTHAESPDGPGLHQPRAKCGEQLWLHLSRQLAAFVRVTGLYGDKGVWQNDSSILDYSKGHLALRLDLARAPVALGSSVKRESEPLIWDGVQLSAKAS